MSVIPWVSSQATTATGQVAPGEHGHWVSADIVSFADILRLLDHYLLVVELLQYYLISDGTWEGVKY